MDEPFKTSIKKAFPTQPVPRELEQRMYLREQAVTIGRRAEAKLRANPQGDTKELMAQAMIGRVAMLRDLPQGVSVEKLTRSLQKTPAFEKYTAQPLQMQIDGLKTRALLQTFAPAKPAPQAQTPAKSVEPKQIEPPQKGLMP